MKKYIGFTLGLFLMFSPVYASTQQEQLVSLLTQVIALLEQQVQVLMAQLSQIQSVATSTPTSIPIVVPVFGSVQPIIQPLINQITMPPEQTLVCTLSAESLTGAPSSYVNLTWTSNADAGTLTNSRTVGLYTLDNDKEHPVTGATQAFQLSSEAGENNIFTAHFVLKEQTKDCSVTVTTQ